MFFLTVFKKIKETRLKFSQGIVTALQKITNHEEAKVKITNSQLKKFKSATKNKAWTILSITKKNFQDEELPHELFLLTRLKTITKNDFANNMLLDIKLDKVQLSEINQSGGFLVLVM